MYRIYLLNFGYYLQDELHSWTEAKAKALNTGMQVQIHDEECKLLASHCPLRGWRYYDYISDEVSSHRCLATF